MSGERENDNEDAQDLHDPWLTAKPKDTSEHFIDDDLDDPDAARLLVESAWSPVDEEDLEDD